MLTDAEQKEMDELEAEILESEIKSNPYAWMYEQDDNPLESASSPQVIHGGAGSGGVGKSIAAAATGVGDQFTGGFSDELAAGLEKGFAKLPEFLGGMSDEEYASIYGNRDNDSLAQVYRDQKAKIAKDNPFAYNTGRMGGGVAQGILLRGALGSSGNALNTLPGLMGEGAALASIQSMGDATGDFSNRIQNVPEAAAYGAGAGALGYGAGKVLQKGAEGVSRGVDELRELAFLKSIGGTKRELQGLINKKNIPQLIDDTKDVIKPFRSFEAISDAAEKGASGIGEEIGMAYQNIDEAIELAIQGGSRSGRSLQPTARDFIRQMARDLNASVGKDPRLAPQFGNVLKDLQRRTLALGGPNRRLSLRDMNEIRSALGSKGYNLGRVMDSEGQQAFQQAERAIRGRIDSAIGQVDELGILPGAKEGMGELNRLYSNFKPVKDITEGEMGRRTANRLFGLSEQLGAGVGIGSELLSPDDSRSIEGGAGKAVLGMLGAAGVKRFGAPVAFTTMDAIKPFVQRMPELFGKYAPLLSQAIARGSQDYAVMNYVLSEKDPEYRMMMDRAQKEIERTQGESR